MNDAYNIGITLSLDDEISPGIAAIRGDLESLNQALGESLSELAALRAAAGPALAAARGASAAIRPAPVAKKAESVETPAWSAPPAAAPAARNEAAPESSESAANPEPALPAHPFAPPPMSAREESAAPQPSRIEVLPFASAAMPRGAAEPARAPAAPSAARLAAPPPPPPLAPEGLALDDLLALTRGLMPSAPFADAAPNDEGAPRENARAVILNTMATPRETAAPAASAAMPRTRPLPQASRAATATAPASPLFDAGPPAAPSGPSPASAGGTVSIHGDVFLDGARVGHWFGETLAASAARPPSGYSGVDPRLGPLWPGAPVVP